MSNIVLDNNRIAKNTIFLYLRMMLLMIVSLYTSRVVLSTLGIEDYGIYNVVGGFISMFAFLNGAMSGCTQRYITIALGKGNMQKLKKVFSTCLIVHGMIALIVFLLAETIGLWFVLEKLVIPSERMVVAMIVYQCSIISTIVLIMSFPYNADIIAHEKMSAFAYISIFEVFANLGIVYLLNVIHFDKLLIYSVLLLLVKVLIIMIYRIYCKRHFLESTFHWLFDKEMLKEMLSFTSWNLFGGMAGTLMGQGVNVLLNIFFGPTVNAARGIAVQVQGTIQQFATNFQTAVNPQLMKTYADGDLHAMHMLLFRSTKFTFMLLLCLMLPLILEIDFVLKFWLKNVPQYTNVFVCLMLCISMIDAISNPLMTASAATGKVKVYQTVVGSILLSILPIAYIFLKLGAEPYIVFAVHLSIAFFAFFARIFIIRRMVDLSIKEYVFNAIFPCIKVVIPSIAISLSIKYVLPNDLEYAFLVAISTLMVVSVISYIFGLTESEHQFVLSKLAILKR